jgi:hypothetical protein
MGLMKYAGEMASGAMIYIPSLIKTGSGIQKLTGKDSQTHRQHGDSINLLYESGPKSVLIHKCNVMRRVPIDGV